MHHFSESFHTISKRYLVQHCAENVIKITLTEDVTQTFLSAIFTDCGEFLSLIRPFSILVTSPRNSYHPKDIVILWFIFCDIRRIYSENYKSN